MTDDEVGLARERVEQMRHRGVVVEVSVRVDGRTVGHDPVWRPMLVSGVSAHHADEVLIARRPPHWCDPRSAVASKIVGTHGPTSFAARNRPSESRTKLPTMPWCGGCTPVTNVAWFGYVDAGSTRGHGPDRRTRVARTMCAARASRRVPATSAGSPSSTRNATRVGGTSTVSGGSGSAAADRRPAAPAPRVGGSSPRSRSAASSPSAVRARARCRSSRAPPRTRPSPRPRRDGRS